MTEDLPEAPPQGEHVPSRPPLDREVAAGLETPAPWRLAGLTVVLALVVANVVLVVVVVLAGLPLSHGAQAVYGLVASGLGALLVWLAGNRVAVRYGGWRAAFGFTLPEAGEGGLVLRWFGLNIAVRLALAAALVPLLPKGAKGGNLEGVSGLPVWALVAFATSAVLVAPVLEELMFRGVLLRALMRRLAFWPAAVVSSAVFAALHLGGISDWSAAAPALLFTLSFGLLQCLLVRRTARLGPAMGVHATTNLVFLALALAGGA